MACSCAKKKSSAEDPIVLGEPTGEPPLEAFATITLLGARAGERVWVTGAQVPALLDGGWLRPV